VSSSRALPTAAPTPLQPEAKIALLDPGAEPRKVLRYRPRAGLKRTLSYVLESQAKTEQNGQSAAAQSVLFTLTVDGRSPRPTTSRPATNFM